MSKTEIQGGRKAPRKHDPRWKDNTSAARTKSRTAQDNAGAQIVSGGKYTTLRKLMTAYHRGEIILLMRLTSPKTEGKHDSQHGRKGRDKAAKTVGIHMR